MRKLRSQRLRRVPVIPIIVNATPKVRFSLIAESGRETYCLGVEPSETSGGSPEKPAAAAQRPGRERIQNAQYTRSLAGTQSLFLSGDGAAVSQEDELTLQASEQHPLAEILLFDLE